VLRDLWNDEVVRVSERVATYYARPATTLFARVIQGSEGEREMHGVTSFPRAEMLDLVHHLKLTHRAMRERQPDLSDQEFFKDVMPWIQRSWLASFRSPPRKRKTSPREERMPSGDRILQLKIALEDVRPQVWRRLLVPERMTLGTLSKTLERVMGWESYHLHEFEIDGISYGMPDPDYPSDVRNERGRKLANFDFAAGSYFVYRYDFGDGWRHRVRVERVLEPQPGARYPVCIAGSRACRPKTSVVRADMPSFSGYFAAPDTRSTSIFVNGAAAVVATSIPKRSISRRPTRNYALVFCCPASSSSASPASCGDGLSFLVRSMKTLSTPVAWIDGGRPAR